jgi:hypothetical protein
MSYCTNYPGRVREKLAEMLTKALGTPVHAVDIWRQSPRHIRFYGAAVWGADTYQGKRSICSWDTMSDCVRRGFTVEDCSKDRHSFADYEIHVIPIGGTK